MKKIGTIYTRSYEEFYNSCNWYRKLGYKLTAYGEDYQVFEDRSDRIFIFVDIKE